MRINDEPLLQESRMLSTGRDSATMTDWRWMDVSTFPPVTAASMVTSGAGAVLSRPMVPLTVIDLQDCDIVDHDVVSGNPPVEGHSVKLVSKKSGQMVGETEDPTYVAAFKKIKEMRKDGRTHSGSVTVNAAGAIVGLKLHDSA